MGGLIRAIRRFFRFIFVTTISLVVLSAFLAAGAVFFRKPVAEFLIVQTLSLYGFPESRISIDTFSEKTFSASGFELGQGHGSVDTIDVTYNIGELLQGRPESVLISGVRLEADLDKLEEGGQRRSSLNWLTGPLLKSGAIVAIEDVVATLKNSPIGNIALHATGNADFLMSPATFELQFSAIPLDEASPLAAFAFSGKGTTADEGIDISGPTRVSFIDGHLGNWAIDRLEYDDEAQLTTIDRSAVFRLAAPIDLRVRQVSEEGSGTSQDAAEALAFDLKTGTAQITANWETGFSGTAEIVDGNVDIAIWDLQASQINLKIPFEGANLADASVVEARIVDTAAQTRFNPHRIEATFQQDDAEIAMQLSASPEGKRARLTMSGDYNLVSGEGEIDIGPDMIRFSRDDLQPSDISPLLSNFTNTTGVVRVNGNIRVVPNEPIKSSAVLTLKDLDTDFFVLSFDDLSGTFNLIDLLDPKSPPGQTFSARAMTAPLPLEKPVLSLHWVRTGSDPLIQIEKAEGGFADGMIRLKETPFRLAAEENEITIVFDQLSLKTLFEEWAGGRVSGDGVISGEIPVTLTLDGPIITKGELAALSGGFIKVHWGDARESLEAQGNEVALMVQALDNFEYRILKAGVRRPSDGELVLLVQLEGANPEVLDGYPFRINVNLSGDLEDVLAAIAEGQSLTQDLLRARMNDGN